PLARPATVPAGQAGGPAAQVIAPSQTPGSPASNSWHEAKHSPGPSGLAARQLSWHTVPSGHAMSPQPRSGTHVAWQSAQLAPPDASHGGQSWTQWWSAAHSAHTQSACAGASPQWSNAIACPLSVTYHAAQYLWPEHA